MARLEARDYVMGSDLVAVKVCKFGRREWAAVTKALEVEFELKQSEVMRAAPT